MKKPWFKFYPENVPHTGEYPKAPLTKFLDDAVKNYPENTAMIFFGKKISYREFGESVEKFAGALNEIGVKKGDKVALCLPNCPQFPIAFYAILKLGAIVVQTNPLYVERELEFILSNSEAKTIVVLDLVYQKLKNVREKTMLENVIVTSIKDYLPFPLNLLYPIKYRKELKEAGVEKEKVLFFLDLLKKGGKVPKRRVSHEDLAVLQYTGGTTGFPKGVMLSHHNLVVNTIQTRYWLTNADIGNEITLAVLPFFHSYAMTVDMNLSIYLASTMILVPKFDVNEVLKLIDNYKPTLFPGVPTIYVAINNHPEIHKYDVSSIKACISGAAPLPREVQEKFEKLTGGYLVEGYGLTETSPVTHCNPLVGTRKEGSIGIPLPDTNAKIIDSESWKELKVGEVGELAIKGPQVMLGYYKMEKDTKETLKGGWLRTGDIAKMDEDGFFYIVDRKKDMIITGGYNVYPREVEEVLYEHPKVLEAAVIGIPDEYKGEVVKAFVTLKEGMSATEKEIIDFCKGKLAPYKVPKVVEFRKELPKTMVGKILRRELREEELKKK